LGIVSVDSVKVTNLFHQKYRGSRYSFGYPAVQYLEDLAKIFKFLEPQQSIGERLTEWYHPEPEQSTNAILYIIHKRNTLWREGRGTQRETLRFEGGAK
jgi:5-methyltetrahydrofolate--homocysteine methyltransferase